eukprot:NODE_31394_length_398_cov_0.822878.p1 GENE.NODE_31394_length_398_cov_0.822878~~NODE_31394_length_398_cov_0.822878.p1  ORF type:complete len:59 (+),score=9.26 NODE_31394_length_398_cov_0.822878:215-391(+)
METMEPHVLCVDTISDPPKPHLTSFALFCLKKKKKKEKRNNSKLLSNYKNKSIRKHNY